VHGEPQKRYLITQDANNRPLLNVVDFSQTTMSHGAVMAPYNTSLHLPAPMHYCAAMAVLDERATPAPSMVYLKRYRSDITQIIGVNLDQFATDPTLANCVHILDTYTARDANMIGGNGEHGEMQISPDGKYLAVSSRTQSFGVFLPGNSQLRLYRITSSDGTLGLVNTQNYTNRTISGLDFSPNGDYLYFVTTAANVTRANRVELPTMAVTETILLGATEVRRTVHGAMLMTQGQSAVTLTNPDAPLATAVATIPSIWNAGSQSLYPHVALQPLIVYNTPPVAHRAAGNKNYELTDHLGNVRVVVSDLKLSTLDIDNEPYDFTADMVSKSAYYAFGSLLPGRHFPGNSSYNFGFNGMLTVNEMAGQHNHYTAEYWEMDPRIGRRWNRDPIFKEWESPYAILLGNPITYVDPSGADPEDPPKTVQLPEFEVFGKASAWSKFKNGLKVFFQKAIIPTAIFIGGAADAHTSNASLGLHQRTDPDMFGASSGAFYYGQVAGDIFSMAQGAAEFTTGAAAVTTGTVGGVALAPVTGGGSLAVGAAVDAGGIALAGHGVAMGALGAQNIIDDITKRSHDSMHGGGGKNSPHANAKARQKALGDYKKAKSEFERVGKISNKTPEQKKMRDKLQRLVEHLKRKADFKGETHHR